MSEGNGTNEKNAGVSNALIIGNAKNIWEMLCKPEWTKDSLIELGKVIFARVQWKDLDNQTKLLFASISARLDYASVTIVNEAETKDEPKPDAIPAPSKPDIQKASKAMEAAKTEAKA